MTPDDDVSVAGTRRGPASTARPAAEGPAAHGGWLRARARPRVAAAGVLGGGEVRARLTRGEGPGHRR